MNLDTRKLAPLEVSAWQDLFHGLLRWELWSRLGFLEVKRRYRRTIIGPFWSAISLGIFVSAMGAVGMKSLEPGPRYLSSLPSNWNACMAHVFYDDYRVL